MPPPRRKPRRSTPRNSLEWIIVSHESKCKKTENQDQNKWPFRSPMMEEGRRNYCHLDPPLAVYISKPIKIASNRSTYGLVLKGLNEIQRQESHQSVVRYISVVCRNTLVDSHMTKAINSHTSKLHRRD